MLSDTTATAFRRFDRPFVIGPADDGAFRLPARLAITYGQELAYRPSPDILSPWRQEHDVAEWNLDVREQGHYEVWVTLAADDASGGRGS